MRQKPFFNKEPWDLPVVIDGRRYIPADLMILQSWGMSSVDFFNLLSDIEAALIEAAGRRGIKLKRRWKVDEGDTFAAPPQRSKQASGNALGE